MLAKAKFPTEPGKAKTMSYLKGKQEARGVVGYKTSGIRTLLSGKAEPTGDHGDLLLHNHGTMKDFTLTT